MTGSLCFRRCFTLIQARDKTVKLKTILFPCVLVVRCTGWNKSFAFLKLDYGMIFVKLNLFVYERYQEIDSLMTCLSHIISFARSITRAWFIRQSWGHFQTLSSPLWESNKERDKPEKELTLLYRSNSAEMGDTILFYFGANFPSVECVGCSVRDLGRKRVRHK